MSRFTDLVALVRTVYDDAVFIDARSRDNPRLQYCPLVTRTGLFWSDIHVQDDALATDSTPLVKDNIAFEVMRFKPRRGANIESLPLGRKLKRRCGYDLCAGWHDRGRLFEVHGRRGAAYLTNLRAPLTEWRWTLPGEPLAPLERHMSPFRGFIEAVTAAELHLGGEIDSAELVEAWPGCGMEVDHV